MKPTEVIYSPSIYVEFTRAEAEVFRRCASCHYDHKCKMTSQPGGFVYGMCVKAEHSDGVADWLFSWDEIDTLSKIIEVPPPDVAAQALALVPVLRQCFDHMRTHQPEPINVALQEA